MIRYNRKIFHIVFILVFPVITVLLFSCTDFFSSSWASWAARDPAKLIPDVTPDNVDELIEIAQNDPDLSLELLIKIGEAAEGASDEEKAKLQAAAVEAAANAVGLGQTILGAAGGLTDLEDGEDAKDAILDAVNSMPNLDEASSSLYDTLPKDAPHGEEFENFIDTATPDEIALAAILLLAGEAKKNDGEEYVDNFRSSPTSPEAQLALDLAASLADKEGELSGSLHDILESLNLL